MQTKRLLCIEVQKDLDDVRSCKLSLFTERPPSAKTNNTTFPRKNVFELEFPIYQIYL